MGGRLFGGADHGWQDVGLERRAWTLAQAVSRSVGAQGAATDVSALRVGVIGPGDHKSIQPMAKRLALGECDQLHHFIAAGVWDAAPVETELLVQADMLVGGDDAVLVIDDTAISRRARIRWVSLRNMLRRSARPRTARPWFADAGPRRSPGHAGVTVVSSRELDE